MGGACSWPKEDSRSRVEREEMGLWWVVVGGIEVRVTMCWVERWCWREEMRGVKSFRAVWYCRERGPCLW